MKEDTALYTTDKIKNLFANLLGDYNNDDLKDIFKKSFCDFMNYYKIGGNLWIT